MAIAWGRLEAILDRYPPSPEHLISALQDVQKEFGYISDRALFRVCDHLEVPRSTGWAVATFYKSLSLQPKGEHEMAVCLGTACHLKGGRRIVDDLERNLCVEAGGTTKDLKFSLDTVHCVGACALAPVMLVDHQYRPKMTSRKLKKMVKELLEN